MSVNAYFITVSLRLFSAVVGESEAFPATEKPGIEGKSLIAPKPYCHKFNNLLFAGSKDPQVDTLPV